MGESWVYRASACCALMCPQRAGRCGAGLGVKAMPGSIPAEAAHLQLEHVSWDTGKLGRIEKRADSRG